MFSTAFDWLKSHPYITMILLAIVILAFGFGIAFHNEHKEQQLTQVNTTTTGA
jgi:hypothetical protein